MAKPTIRDILPPEHRPKKRRPSSDSAEPSMDTGASRRPPFFDRRAERQEPPQVHENRVDRTFEDFDPNARRGGKMKYVYYAVGLILGIVLISFLFSIFFGGAEVTVHPKEDSLTVSGQFHAVASNPKQGELQYDLMTLESLLTKTVPATGSEQAEVKASGQIIIYNDFNTSPQRLIRNTRFETPEGLIYRIDKSVVVPGQTTEGGKTVPGSIEVTVYADEPGDSYNIGLTDFTIPGFKGAPQFEHFYAQSKTPMTGGFEGERLVVEDSVLQSEREKLHQDLKDELMSQVPDQLPDGFASFDSGIFIVYSSETPAEKGNDLEIREKAVLYDVLFNEDDLAKYLAVNTLASFDGSQNVSFKDGADLKLTPLPPADDEPIEPWKTGEFNFNMSGNADIVWQFDQDKLKEDLVGRNKEAIHTILSGYPSIDEAEVVIRPFWKGTFPEDTKDIKINIVTSE